MNKKNALVLSAICTIAIGGYLYGKTSSEPDRSHEHYSNLTQENAGNIKNSVSEVETKKYAQIQPQNKLLAENPIKTSDLEIPSKLEIEASTTYSDKKWKEDRGIYPDSELAIYRSYDTETLLSLADNNDMLALQALAWKSLEKENIKDAEAHLKQSMVHGDTEAINILSIFYEQYSSDVRTGKITKEEAMKSMGVSGYTGSIERLVTLYKYGLMLVLEIRGDSSSAGAAKIDIEYDLNLPLNKEEIDFSRSFAFTFYEELAKEREELGLDPFDNTQMEVFGGQESSLFREYLAKK